eukprot:TRINITY_DN4993_c1_g4_i1.p2 TRINITY_DN4993_c1_g4~~TRINITY_DN4993_c1_g4_i1.p2  ORF type:complete len:199 (+),score=56.29 TRINITY_DN4993_c1_g4_i1:73-597(+)
MAAAAAAAPAAGSAEAAATTTTAAADCDARASLAALLRDVGIRQEDCAPDAIDQLFGVACSEAADLFARASRLAEVSGRGGSGGSSSAAAAVNAADLRLAWELQQNARRGEGSADARRFAESVNAAPLPPVHGIAGPELPEDTRLLEPLSTEALPLAETRRGEESRVGTSMGAS